MVSEDIPFYSACEIITVPIFIISQESDQLCSSRAELGTPASTPSATTEEYRTKRQKWPFQV